MLILSLFITTLLAQPTYAQSLCARTSSAEPKNPLVHNASLGFNDPKILDLFSLSQEERLDISCQIREAILNRYSLVGLKQERIGLDMQKHLDSCVAKEAKITKSSRLQFSDRIRSCIAKLQDTHFGIGLYTQVPTVTLPILLARVQGKVVIVRKLPKLISLIEARDGISNLDKELEIGNEIVQIEGVDTQVWLESMSDYVDGSSLEYRLDMAAYYLARRNFLYPKKNLAKLKIKKSNGKTVDLLLPWTSTKEGQNVLDFAQDLKNKGIPSHEEIALEYDSQTRKWKGSSIASEGYRPWDSLVSNNTLQEFTDKEEGGVALRTAEVLESRKVAYCYMQLLTFSTYYMKAPDKSDTNFLDEIKNFAENCEKKELPMVLDLRSNGGGNASFPSEVMKILTKKDQKSLGIVTTYRANRHSLWLLSQAESATDLGARILNNELFSMNAEYLAEAMKSGKAYADISFENPIEPALDSGFNQDLVVLLTPDCISACDMMSALIKQNKRGTIIGTHSNGTGAGFSRRGELSALFSDSYQFFRFSIPNFLFGFQDKEGYPERGLYSAHKGLIGENKPTQADVKYETTLEDLKSKGSGWLTESKKILFKQ
ncbi:MAG: S41 family peptidase [Oligoflexia bacterium]|nr:S41 family peptidase [Oligoflexia bacterium]